MNDNFDIDIQFETKAKFLIPTEADFLSWTEAALNFPEGEVTIRIVDEAESAQLNKSYRQKEGATNVLSFPMSSPHNKKALYGDIVICAPIVNKEAQEQEKQVKDHFAHLTVHGILHLQGFDHIKEEDAKIMEALEVQILSKLGFPNPYE